MDWNDYRRAFQSVEFSDDFQRRTIQKLLAQTENKYHKEYMDMNIKKLKRGVVLLTALMALLSVSVSAALLRLSPSEAADEMNKPKLAEAFRQDDAVLIDETQTVGEYSVTLMGIVPGKNLLNETISGDNGTFSEAGCEIDRTRSYVILAMARTDGTALQRETYNPFACTVTPLVEGYRVDAVNTWTLDSSAMCQIIDGTAYYILDTQNLEIFADHTVYLAVYDGGAPGLDEFSMTKDGAIIMRDEIDGAMFVLPLDENKANPAAVKALLKANGITDYTPITDEELAALLVSGDAEQDTGKNIDIYAAVPPAHEVDTDEYITQEQREMMSVEFSRPLYPLAG